MSPDQLHQSRLRRTVVDGIHPKKGFDISGAKVAVIGLDRDGLSVSGLAAAGGFETIGFDDDEVKVVQLEAHQEQALKSTRNLSITSDESKLQGADIFIICAATPELKNGRPDLAWLEKAAEIAGRNLREGGLVIVESIVPPGVCEHVVLPIVEKQSGLARPRNAESQGEFFFAHAPFFADTMPAGTPRIVGAPNDKSLSRATAFYRSVLGADVHPMQSLKETEAVRTVEDSFRDITLALSGEFAMLFDYMEIDIVNIFKNISPEVFDTAALSGGVGRSRTSPAAYYFGRSGHERETEQQFLAAARRIIAHMPEYAVKVLSDALREKKIMLKGATVALLGLSDANEQDTQESVGSKIRNALERKSANVSVYDPYVAGAGRELKETLKGAQAVLIATSHPIFCNLTARQFEEFGISVVVDARNCLDKNLFAGSPVLYRGIGRG